MNPQHDRAKEIFLNAVDIASAAERHAYLATACAGDEGLRLEVEDFLGHHQRLGPFLQSGAGGEPATADSPPLGERPGEVIGPYKLLQQIGEGGMGTVWMAEQTEPVRRKVALKVIKPGMDSRQVVARFEAERQALALMDHVNIARVFDGGTTQAGRPYFVMELVHGVPITRYCDDHRLTPRQRLELFVPVCQALQHAHQKGIIHRDLKPSNVMIMLYDGKAVPKVIDFGVAKATEQRLTERTLFTQYGALVGTLEYMSPEQAEMSALGVDTRSDIYSLGVLLYELLTGTTPLSHKRVREAPYGEILRMIKEEEPPKPSARLSDSGEALASISAQRHMEPAKLAKLMRGELDWIVMKGLEKDRNRRYETANGFAADVQRYLTGEAVQAVPPSAWYRLRKFARRNKAGLGVAGLVLFFLVLLGGGAGWALRDREDRRAAAEREADTALQEATRLAIQRKWPEALAWVQRAEAALAGGGGGEDLRQRVHDLQADLKAVVRLEETRLHGSKAIKSAFEYDRLFAEVFRELGVDVDTLDPQQAGDRLQARPLAEDLAGALDDWSSVRQEMGRRDWETLTQVARFADPDPWRNQIRDAWVRRDRKALSALAGADQIDRMPAAFLTHIAWMLGNLEEREQAVTILRRGQRRFPDDFWINTRLATWLGQSNEGLRFRTAAVASRPHSPEAHYRLGTDFEALGNWDEAIAEYQEARRLSPNFPPALLVLGRLLYEQKRDYAGGIACYKELLALMPDDADANNDLAWVLCTCPEVRLRDPASAVRLAKKAVELEPQRGPLWNTLGAAHYRAGNWNEAVAALEKSVEIQGGGTSIDFFFLAMTHRKLGNKEGARKWFDQAVQWMEKNQPQDEELRSIRAEAADLLGVIDVAPFP